MDYLHRQALKPKLCLARGLQLLRVEGAGVVLLDSLCFLPMALSAMPKAFGLEGAKGYFPHHFNREENWNYKGPLPDAW
jgi:hypothetical protein